MILGDVRRAYDIQHKGQKVELRAINQDNRAVTGIFDDPTKLFQWIEKLDKDPVTKAVWWNVNALGCIPANNDLKSLRGAVKKQDIAYRTHLPIDCDVNRGENKDHPSSDDELAEADRMCNNIFFFIRSVARFDVEMIVMSGNGMHLYIRLDEWANNRESEAVLDAFLEYVAEIHDPHFPRVKIDLSTADAPQVMKVPGSRSRKGIEIEGRPHRDSKILYENADARPVTLTEMKAFLDAHDVPYTPNTSISIESDNIHPDFDLEDFLAHLADATGAEVLRSEDRADGATYHLLSMCPMADRRHRGTSKKTAIVTGGKYGLGFKCFSASRDGESDGCNKKTIGDLLRKLVELGRPYKGKIFVDQELDGSKWGGIIMGDEVDEVETSIAEGLTMNTGVFLNQDNHHEFEVTGNINLTDLGNSKRLLKAFGHDLLYCGKQRAWYLWDGTRWIKTEDVSVHQFAKATVQMMDCDSEDEERQKAFARHKMVSEGKARIEAMVSLARGDVPVLPRQFDGDKMLLNVANGTLDLRDGAFHGHARTDKITKISRVMYDPTASCPRWEQFMSEIMDENQAMVEYLQRAVGYSLTGDTTEQCLFVLIGAGGDGKSTFLNMLKYIAGDYSETAAFNSFTAKKNNGTTEDIAKLWGARVVTAIESDAGERLSVSLIKTVTGCEEITARFLYEGSFSFTPEFKLWMATNHVPKIIETDDGIWRRVKHIHFPVQFLDGRRDKHLGEKLKAEASGILNWALDGLRAWREGGLQEPARVTESTLEYRAGMDVIGHFIEDRCSIDPTRMVGKRPLYEAYKSWAKDAGEFLLGDRDFRNDLLKRGFVERRTKSSRMWVGIGLFAEQPSIDEDSNGEAMQGEAPSPKQDSRERVN
jgi:P4 family phage/plasmid primase-like protien